MLRKALWKFFSGLILLSVSFSFYPWFTLVFLNFFVFPHLSTVLAPSPVGFFRFPRSFTFLSPFSASPMSLPAHHRPLSQLAGYFRHAFPKMRYAFPGKSGHRMHLAIISASLSASHRLSLRVHWAPTRQSMASTHQHVALHRPLRPLCDSFRPPRASAWL
ncbi:hypothetical protein SLA2020_369590 [Shorea laevis]